MSKAYFYHKDFPDGQIFERGKEPKGCVEHPDDLKKSPPKKKADKEELSDEQRQNDH